MSWYMKKTQNVNEPNNQYKISVLASLRALDIYRGAPTLDENSPYTGNVTALVEVVTSQIPLSELDEYLEKRSSNTQDNLDKAIENEVTKIHQKEQNIEDALFNNLDNEDIEDDDDNDTLLNNLDDQESIEALKNLFSGQDILDKDIEE